MSKDRTIKTTTSSPKAKRHPSFFRFWVLGLLGIFAASSYFYYKHRLSEEKFANINYFRILSESAQAFNEKLSQLATLIKYDESDANIRSVFPSFRKPASTSNSTELTNKANLPMVYRVTENAISIEKKTQADTEDSKYHIHKNISIDDILPIPVGGFSSYLIVDKDNKVIAVSGESSALSIINTQQISQQLRLSEQQSWQNLAKAELPETEQDQFELPGYSRLLDIELTSEEYRLFIYPFKLNEQVRLKNHDYKTIEALYLIGVLPKERLKTLENQRWNLTVLTLVLALLIFIWLMARLFMLSNNQPVGDLFYRSVMVCSYLLFVLVVALFIAYSERSMEQQSKQLKAEQLMTSISTSLDRELNGIITELQKFQTYFTQIIHRQTELSSGEKSLTKMFDCSLKSTLIELENSSQTAPAASNISSFLKDNQLTLDQNIAPVGYYRVNSIAWQKACENFNKSTQTSDSQYNLFLALIKNINIFASGISSLNSPSYQDVFSGEARSNSAQNKILSALLLSAEDGINSYPTYINSESNKPPTQYDLTHREYYKAVREKRGWTLKLSGSSEHIKIIDNIYIQRLRNVNSGVKGTTLAMPLESKSTSNKDKQSIKPKYILVSDIELTSLSMPEFISKTQLLDMVYMVVDRNSGEVLFHLDDERAMIENLFEHGQGTDAISHRIKAGLGGRAQRPVQATDGYYHGAAGTFVYRELPIKQWALVIFMPDESLDNYMTNLFLVIALTLTTVLAVIAVLGFGLRKFVDTGRLKKFLNIPLVIDRRKIMVFSSIFFSSIYLGYWIGMALFRNDPSQSSYSYVYLVTLIAVLLTLIWGCYKYRSYYALSRQMQREPIPSERGCLYLLAVFTLSGAMVFYYLTSFGLISSGSLNWYYTTKVWPARILQEKNELREMASTRFPNSINLHYVNPLDVLPISNEWRKVLESPSRLEKEPYLEPEDVDYFTKLINTTDMYEFIQRYIFDTKGFRQREETTLEKPDGFNQWSDKYQRKLSDFSNLAFLSVGFLSLCWLWVLFNQNILAHRIYGPRNFLRHLNQIVNRRHRSEMEFPSRARVFDLVNTPKEGYSLCYLVSLLRGDRSRLPELYEQLFSQCPEILELCESNDAFPGLKIRVEVKEENKILYLWGFDLALKEARLRQLLLKMINYFKSLQETNELDKLVIYCNFQHLQHLFFKNSELSIEKSSRNHLDNSEYFNWSWCFKDFTVLVPFDLKENIDKTFIQQEIKAFPALGFIQEELHEPTVKDAQDNVETSFDTLRWLNLNDRQKTYDEWSSISFILIKAEAFYRFKWESCTQAEKLALYYLVKQKRINPSNLQMLEHLAQKGLIIVKCGRVHIVNKSFAFFVEYAEDKATMDKLVEVGNLGRWQDYRLPVTLLILMIIVIIALTSGNSLYMIVASIMGVLGTISSLTNSANMIRMNLQR